MNSPTLEDFVGLRKNSGLSAREVSLALYLHENYISRVERGERPWKEIYYFALLGLGVHRPAESS